MVAGLKVGIFSLPHQPSPSQCTPTVAPGQLAEPSFSGPSRRAGVWGQTSSSWENIPESRGHSRKGSSPEPYQLKFFDRWDNKRAASAGMRMVGQSHGDETVRQMDHIILTCLVVMVRSLLNQATLRKTNKRASAF